MLRRRPRVGQVNVGALLVGALLASALVALGVALGLVPQQARHPRHRPHHSPAAQGTDGPRFPRHQAQRVPRQLDGRLSPGEWQDALHLPEREPLRVGDESRVVADAEGLSLASTRGLESYLLRVPSQARLRPPNADRLGETHRLRLGGGLAQLEGASRVVEPLLAAPSHGPLEHRIHWGDLGVPPGGAVAVCLDREGPWNEAPPRAWAELWRPGAPRQALPPVEVWPNRAPSGPVSPKLDGQVGAQEWAAAGRYVPTRQDGPSPPLVTWFGNHPQGLVVAARFSPEVSQRVHPWVLELQLGEEAPMWLANAPSQGPHYGHSSASRSPRPWRSRRPWFGAAPSPSPEAARPPGPKRLSVWLRRDESAQFGTQGDRLPTAWRQSEVEFLIPWPLLQAHPGEAIWLAWSVGGQAGSFRPDRLALRVNAPGGQTEPAARPEASAKPGPTKPKALVQAPLPLPKWPQLPRLEAAPGRAFLDMGAQSVCGSFLGAAAQPDAEQRSGLAPPHLDGRVDPLEWAAAAQCAVNEDRMRQPRHNPNDREPWPLKHTWWAATEEALWLAATPKAQGWRDGFVLAVHRVPDERGQPCPTLRLRTPADLKGPSRVWGPDGAPWSAQAGASAMGPQGWEAKLPFQAMGAKPGDRLWVQWQAPEDRAWIFPRSCREANPNTGGCTVIEGAFEVLVPLR